MCDRWRPTDPELGAPVRAVVGDAPGDAAITLSLFGEDGAAVCARLSAHRAIVLAGRLIEAASRRLG